MLKLWNPFELANWRKLWTPVATVERPFAWPTIETVEEDGATTVRVDLAGMAPEEVEVRVEDDALAIEGRHEEKHVTEGRSYHRVETFVRRMALPPQVDREAVRTETTDGVVTITLPDKRAA